MKQKKKEMARMFFHHPVSKFKKRDFHGSPVARTLSFQCSGQRIRFLLGEPRSHMLHSTAKKKSPKILRYLRESSGLPCMVKNPTCSAGDLDSISGSGRSPGEEKPLQYSCLEKPMEKGAWQATVHGPAKSWTQLSNYTLKESSLIF